MVRVRQERVAALPEPATPDTIYYVKAPGAGTLRMFVAGADGVPVSLEAIVPPLAPLLENLTGEVFADAFGAIGDGIADDGPALNAFLAYLSENGSRGRIKPGTYRTTQRIYLTGSTSPFALIFDRGAVIKADFAADSSIMEVQNSSGFNIHDPQLDGGYSGVAGQHSNHGLVFYRCRDARVTGRTFVRNWKNSGVLVYGEEADQFANVVFESVDLVSDAKVANNGMLFINMYRSGVEQMIHVSGVTGSPGYAVQFKDGCKECFYNSWRVEDSRTALAFGQGLVNGVQTVNSRIGGGIAMGCGALLTAGYATGNTIGPCTFDGGNQDVVNYTGHAIDLQYCDANVVTAAIRNVAAANKFAVNLRLDVERNDLDVTVDNCPRWVQLIGTNNKIRIRNVGTAAPTTKVNDLSVGATNFVFDQTSLASARASLGIA